MKNKILMAIVVLALAIVLGVAAHQMGSTSETGSDMGNDVSSDADVDAGVGEGIDAGDAAQASDTEVIVTEDETSYGQEVSALVKEVEEKREEALDENSPEFATGRLLMETDGIELDVNAYGADTVIVGPNGQYTMQFASAEAAQAACEQILALDGVNYCEADRMSAFGIE